MKRLISTIVTISIFLTMSSTCFASNKTAPNNLSNIYVEDIENGTAYLAQTEDITVTILTDTQEDSISISLSYTSAPDIVYQWVFDNYSLPLSTANEPSFISSVIDYAENRKDAAEIIHFTYEEAEEALTRRSSANADLIEDLIDLLGEDEYGETLIEQKFVDGNRLSLYESLQFNIEELNTLSWDDAITVASFITGIVGIATTGGTVSLVCGIFGIGSSVATALIPEGSATRYGCTALYSRTAAVNGDEKAWAYKVISYDGYEDNDRNSRGRAHILPDTGFSYYDPKNEYLFEEGLLDEAYDRYLESL